MLKMMSLFNVEMAGGPEHYHTLYDTHIPADLHGAVRPAAVGRGQGRDRPASASIPRCSSSASRCSSRAAARDGDLEAWFAKLIERVQGPAGEDRRHVRRPVPRRPRRARQGPATASSRRARSSCGGGGMKGYKDAPDDWEDQVKYFFGIDRLGNQYGLSECIGNAPLCEAGYFHFLPYQCRSLMDPDGEALPREGVQTGRLVLVDLIAEILLGRLHLGRRGDDPLGRGLRLRLEGPARRPRPSAASPRSKAATTRSPAPARSRRTTSSWNSWREDA